jgi:hypothetical protein
MAGLIKKHREFLPKTSAPILGKRSTGHQAFDAAEEKVEKSE